LPYQLSDDADEDAKNVQKTTTLYTKEKGASVNLNDFALLKVLGRGAFGKVMLVKKKDTQEQFALKSMKKAELVQKD